ncbi:MAG TPA: hypothetical protein VMW48_05815, partial [Vicinamibacterales bacterium]|nr:hypothetical protein [Vicinamibacterales bacterium]
MTNDLQRRTFVGLALAGIPLTASGQGAAPRKAVRVPAGQDRSGAHKGLGISTIDIKVTTDDTAGSLLVIENTNRAKGGPARHSHTAQDELFYVLEGEYV